MVRTDQGGSILGFIVVGGVMALLLVGGAYFVRQNLMPGADSEPVAVDEGVDTDDSTDTETSDEWTPSDQDDNEDQEQQDDDSREDTGVVSPQQPSDSGTLPGTGQTTTTPSALPETGLADAVLTSFLISGVVAAAVAYLRSRAPSVSL